MREAGWRWASTVQMDWMKLRSCIALVRISCAEKPSFHPVAPAQRIKCWASGFEMHGSGVVYVCCVGCREQIVGYRVYDSGGRYEASAQRDGGREGRVKEGGEREGGETKGIWANANVSASDWLWVRGVCSCVSQGSGCRTARSLDRITGLNQVTEEELEPVEGGEGVGVVL
jgi:hypothetical protein